MSGLCGPDLEQGLSLSSIVDWSELAHSAIKDAGKWSLALSQNFFLKRYFLL